MLQLIDFIKKKQVAILFLLLEIIALTFVFRNHSYHQSKFLNSSNYLSGTIHKKKNIISNYFSLNTQNNVLLEENEFLKNQLEKYIRNTETTTTISDSSKYEYIVATVVNSPYTKTNNILTIDKGEEDGIHPNMGVVLSNGIVGITLNSSKHFTTVLSVLNHQAKFNVKLKKSHHYGSLEWKENNFSKINITDLPIQANIEVGDTIISGGKSVIFPERIPIGVVQSFTIKDRSYDQIIVKPFIDYSSLHSVYVVKNFKANEQLELENQHE